MLRRKGGERLMTKQSTYTSYEQLPLFLDAKLLSALLGISRSGVYELMHEAGFPSVRIGSRIVVPSKDFLEWIDAHRGEGI